jgi:hypothetical protein
MERPAAIGNLSQGCHAVDMVGHGHDLRQALFASTQTQHGAGMKTQSILAAVAYRDRDVHGFLGELGQHALHL